MREFNYGDMLWADCPPFGKTLYMVVGPPFVCESCGTVNKGWFADEDGEVSCSRCGAVVREFRKADCRCGEKDMVTLTVARNDDFHAESDGSVVPWNHAVNRTFTYCAKALWKDVAEGRMEVLGAEDARRRKKMLVWTEQETYAPGKPIPEWIDEMFG